MNKLKGLLDLLMTNPFEKLKKVNLFYMKKIEKMTVNERAEAFLAEYKKLSVKFGIDFRPTYQVVDTLVVEKPKTDEKESVGK